MEFKLQGYGERAVLINELSKAQQAVLVGRLEVSTLEGVTEYVVGSSNLLVIFETAGSVPLLRSWLEELPETLEANTAGARLIEVPTRYDGEDLEAVAEQAQLTVKEVVAIHSGAEYRVRMMGFAPGFPYLDGLDARLHLDRRGSPRNRIDPGSVAIGGSHAGIYSVASPGGWHLLGKTEMELFRPDAAQCSELDESKIFALRPGDRVKFIQID
ncbi:MAG: 5-oxoprolinase subunit PxpB [Opitutaceae bacterium]